MLPTPNDLDLALEEVAVAAGLPACDPSQIPDIIPGLRRTSRVLTHQGVTLPLTRWARRVGIKPSPLQARLNAGMTDSEALTAPVQPRRPYGQWAKPVNPRKPGRKPRNRPEGN